MNYSLHLLNKVIDKWIAKAYSENPNKEYVHSNERNIARIGMFEF